tara:strand:+ start:680 stop:1534 length:855 start_codon:yes stop_codon:yes gene_type:complete
MTIFIIITTLLIFYLLYNFLYKCKEGFKTSIVYEDESKYQKIKLYEHGSKYWLTLNGQVQFHSDEHKQSHYLQCDVPLLKFKPKKVLILGGGDGLAATHVLKHDFVEEVTMVEIDEKMIKMLKESKLMRKITNNVIDNPKLNVIIGNGFDYIHKTKNKYDIIIEDIEDDHTSQKKIVHSGDYLKKLLEVSKVISQTIGDDEIDYKKKFPIFTKNYLKHKKKYNSPKFELYSGGKEDLFDELEYEDDFLMALEKEDILQDVNFYICGNYYNDMFGFEMYLLSVKN